jgi:hypothetical protein
MTTIKQSRTISHEIFQRLDKLEDDNQQMGKQIQELRAVIEFLMDDSRRQKGTMVATDWAEWYTNHGHGD